MKWERRFALYVAPVCALLVFACGGTGEPGTEGLSEGASEANLAGAPGSGGAAGIVLETMNGGGYTYARFGAGDAEIWVAGPTTTIAVGDTLSLEGAYSVGPFSSPSLDRTFEELFFVDQFRAPGPATAPAAGMEQDTYQGTVIETMDAGGYTYVQVRMSGMGASEGEEPLLWLAGPESEIELGGVVSWQGGSIMREFRSPSLDRTFPEIVFVGSFTMVK